MSIPSTAGSNIMSTTTTESGSEGVRVAHHELVKIKRKKKKKSRLSMPRKSHIPICIHEVRVQKLLHVKYILLLCSDYLYLALYLFFFCACRPCQVLRQRARAQGAKMKVALTLIHLLASPVSEWTMVLLLMQVVMSHSMTHYFLNMLNF